MTTLADITLQVAKKITDVVEGTATTGAVNSLSDTVNLTQRNQWWDKGTLWILTGAHAGKVIPVTGFISNKLSFATLGTVLCVQQVETATVIGTVTGSGNATVVVTAAGMLNSPKTVSVAVLNTDTASLVGGKIRTALAADADVAAFFSISGAGADVVLTAKVALANDTTMNVSVANGTCTGLTAAPISANTTAGVAGPRYAVTRNVFPYAQIRQGVNQALENVRVTGIDETLTGNGLTLEFSLPAGVYDVYSVEFKDTSSRVSPSSHWSERNGKLIFDPYCWPFNGNTIRVLYKKAHDELVNATDVVDDEVNLTWLKWAAAANILTWGIRVYQNDPEKQLDQFLNQALKELERLKPLRSPRLMITTAG